ncbi:MAG: sulfite exporter TauE/SafE family protein [Sandaracinaceae bacterium]
MHDLPLFALALLAVVVLFASVANTVAGAGSLLVLPALIFSGLDATAANATNRVGILVQTAAAIAGFRRAGLSVGREEAKLTLVVMIGGAVGSFLATLLSPPAMQLAIVIAMGVVLALSLVPPRTKDAARADEPSSRGLPPIDRPMIAGFFLIGIYGGFLQAGVGILVLLFLSRVYGASLVASNVLKSTATLGLTLVALGVFAARGETIDLPRGAVLACAAAVGGYAGADVAVRLGDRWIRRVIVVAAVASMGKLLWDLAR